MPDEEIVRIPASIDFSQFPNEMAGKWVVVRKVTRQPLGSGDTLEDALTDAGFQHGDQSVVVARVPTEDFMIL